MRFLPLMLLALLSGCWTQSEEQQSWPTEGFLHVGEVLAPPSYDIPYFKITLAGFGLANENAEATLLVQQEAGQRATAATVLLRKGAPQRVPVGIRCDKQVCRPRTATFTLASPSKGEGVEWKIDE